MSDSHGCGIAHCDSAWRPADKAETPALSHIRLPFSRPPPPLQKSGQPGLATQSAPVILRLAIRDETTTMSMSCHNIAECTSTKNAQLLTTEVVRSDERVSRIASPRVDGRPEVGIVSAISTNRYD
jgi:hypothetical protein